MENNRKYDKSVLEQLINADKISYEEIGRKYGVTGAYIKKIAKLLGVILPVRAKFSPDFQPHNKGMGKKNICLKCNKEFLSHHNHAVYCSRGCEIEHKTSEKYKYYLEHQPDFCFDRDMKFIKKHILIEQENKCKICSMKNIWNEKKIVFILDHIDGNATNNLRNNLRLICPNCDSQLDTFKSKNKNSARKNRYLKNYKN